MHPSSPITRRDVIKGLGAGAALVGLGALGSKAQAAAAPAPAPAAPAAAPASGPFSLPKLAYAYDALEPHIDARTMEIHHSKHHQAYINNANTALKDQADLAALTGIQILQRLPSVPDAIRTAVRNNVGGHVNHSFFWEVLGPGASAPTGALAAAIEKGFGSLDDFKTKFAAAATGRFGSGWAWLNVRNGVLVIESTANQDSPWSDGGKPVLALDVWEHAYYLKYQNLRADYVKAFWNVVNWRKVEANFAAALV